MSDTNLVRRYTVVLALCSACVPAMSAPQSVEISALPQPATAGLRAASFASRCRVIGTGEVEGPEDAPDLAVRETPSGSPIFVVNTRTQVHVTWSNLPPPSAAPGRWAEVELGGQSHVRGRGYADLFGRIFQIEGDAPVVSEHVWVRGGSNVELLGEDARGVHVGVSAYASPGRRLAGTTPCANVLYQPKALEMKVAPTGDSLAMSGSTLHLRVSPQGAALLDLQSNDQEEITLVQLGQSPGFTHVAGVTGKIGFDGWVHDSEVSTTANSGVGGLGLRGYGTSGGGSRNLKTVRIDAPLRVGVAGHSRATNAIIEKGARVYLGMQGQASEPGLVSVDFEDGWIAAPGNESFWIPEVTLD